MRRIVPGILLAAAVALATGEPATRTSLPAPIAAVQEKIQGKDSEQVLAIFTQEFGKPTRDIGSGVHIPQWDIAGGKLTFYEFVGPTFDAEGRTVWLMRTHNPVGENIPGEYDMNTLPAEHGNRLWLGNVDLKPDGTYTFRPADNHLADDIVHASFFAQHPAGTCTVAYSDKLDKSTLLETLSDGVTLATLTFIAPPPARPQMQFNLRLQATDRRLEVISADGKARYQLEKGWKNYWK